MRLCRTNCAFLSNDGLCVEMMVSGRGRVALGCDEPGNSIFIREGLGKTSRAKTLAPHGSRQQSVTEEPALQREAAQGRSRRPEPAGAREPDALLHAVLPDGSSRLQPGRHAGLWL